MWVWGLATKWVIGWSRIALITHYMGCFPDRTLPQYKPLPNDHERLARRPGDPNRNMDSLYVPIEVNETHTAATPARPFNKSQRGSPRKAKVHPAGDQRTPMGKFERRQGSVMKIDDADKQRRINRKRTAHHRVPIDRKKGRLIQSPHKDHIITEIETPSESARTSLLANFENNPSIFFVKMSDKDLDTIFDKKGDAEGVVHRISYRSVSPSRIHRQTSA